MRNRKRKISLLGLMYSECISKMENKIFKKIIFSKYLAYLGSEIQNKLSVTVRNTNL